MMTTPMMSTKDMTVLVVDDDVQLRGSLEGFLGERVGDLVVARNGGEAIFRLRSLLKLDLLVVDVDLGDCGGATVASAARRRFPGARVVFMSALSRTAVMENGVEWLPKPFSPDALAKYLPA
jgi:DNA-binding response OmpR family regulator